MTSLTPESDTAQGVIEAQEYEPGRDDDDWTVRSFVLVMLIAMIQMGATKAISK
jgi:hypothetical protein